MKNITNVVLINAFLILFLLVSCDPVTGVLDPSSGDTVEDQGGGDVVDPGDSSDQGDSTDSNNLLDVITKSGTISFDETWEDGYVYYISNDVFVEATVTIEPGCIIKFNSDRDITVQNGGKILAEGTAAKRIYFTSKYDDRGGDTANSSINPEKQDWDAVKVRESDSVFAFCTFEYGDDTLEIPSSDTKVTITDCTFDKNYYGLCHRYRPSDLTIIERNRFFLNTYPIIMDPRLFIGDTNMFTSEDGSSDNFSQYISMYAWGGIQINEDISFTETELPYWGGNGIVISGDSTLTIDPGVVVTMSPMTMIQIESGSDLSMGSGSVITSTLDDSLNGSPSSTIGATSYWEGIRLGYGSSATYLTGLSGVYFSEN